MPSFVCDKCQETLKKPKLDVHTQRCKGASFSCIDCYKHFKGLEYRDHFSCITEVEKYEKRKPSEKPTKTMPNNSDKSNGPIDAAAAKRSKTEESFKNDKATAVRQEGKKKDNPLSIIKDFIKAKGPLSLRTLQRALMKEEKMSKKEFKRILLKNILISINEEKQELSFALSQK